MNITAILALFGFVAVCFLAAAISAKFPPGQWYGELVKPSWRPPNWLFAPAWTVLYLTIATAGWLVWREVGFAAAALPFVCYFVQLVLNAAWTPIFFGLRRPDLAFFEIVLLWLSVIATMVLFYPLHAGAAWLLLPYLAWVTFAGALNLAIWQLNGASAMPK